MGQRTSRGLGGVLGATALVALGALAMPAAAAPRPDEQMSSLARDLFAALDRERAVARPTPERALALVDGVLAPHFDAEQAAHAVLGAHWRAASALEQQRFARALYRTLLRTYAEQVVEWTPERLKILPFEGDPEALEAVVRTEVSTPGHALARVNYRLHATEDGWKIVDVIVDGVSYTRSYHADLDAEIGRKGLEAAIASLEQRSSAPGRPQPPGSPR